jgi:hypothetical protein
MLIRFSRISFGLSWRPTAARGASFARMSMAESRWDSASAGTCWSEATA